MIGKQKAAMLVAEFMGTFVLASAVLAAIGAGAGLVETATAAGFTLALMVLVIGATSGAHINPAVTLGLWSVRKVETMQAVAYWVAQLLGGVAAWKLHNYLLDTTLPSLATKGYDPKVLIAEALGALVFTFGIAAAAPVAAAGRGREADVHRVRVRLEHVLHVRVGQRAVCLVDEHEIGRWLLASREGAD